MARSSSPCPPAISAAFIRLQAAPTIIKPLTGKPNTTTPEHLFACGYAACFGGALDYVGKLHKKDATKGAVTCAVAIGPRELGGFGLSVKLCIEDKTLPQAELAALVKEAHEKICPYSHATRNNVDVQFEVIGG